MESNSEAALTTLTAFLGAVIGIIGCLAAALLAQAELCIITASGAAVCAGIWIGYVVSFDATDIYELEPYGRD